MNATNLPIHYLHRAQAITMLAMSPVYALRSSIVHHPPTRRYTARILSCSLPDYSYYT